MTGHEISKCEILLYEAIKTAQLSREEFKLVRQCYKNGDMYECEKNQRKSDRHWGCAEGIFRALKTMGFEHKDMQKLHELINW